MPWINKKVKRFEAIICDGVRVCGGQENENSEPDSILLSLRIASTNEIATISLNKEESQQLVGHLLDAICFVWKIAPGEPYGT